MKFVPNLTKEEKITLEEMRKNHRLSYMRNRANSILLSNANIALQTIANICNVCRQTLSIWFDNWEQKGICGLMDRAKSGRPKTLSISQEKEAVKIINKTPRSLNQALAEIKKRWNIILSKSTLKRLCKKAKLSWKRVRKSLRGKRDDEQFYKALKVIKNLIDKADRGEIDFYYFDESGFTLEPCVPYAWQPIGEHIEIPSSKSKRLNVLGFINQNCSFTSVVVEGYVNTQTIVDCFDKFAEKLTKKTFVVLDNASMHTSKLFKENLEKWKGQNLIIQNIPTYSPELNKIEILWKKIKYEWLEFSDYKSYKILKKALNNILDNIGKKYIINFS